MKWNRKSRIVGLCALLVVILAGGGLLIWNFVRPAAPGNPLLEDQRGEYAGVIQEGQSYQEALVLEQSFTLPARYILEDAGRLWMLQTGPQGMELQEITGDGVWPLQSSLESWLEEGDIVTRLAFDPKGFLCCMAYRQRDGQGEVQVARMQEGQAEPLEVVSLHGLESAGKSKFLADDTRFYIGGKGEDTGLGMLQIFRRDGTMEQILPNVNDFALDGEGGLYVLHCDAQGLGANVKKYRAETMEETAFSAAIPQERGKASCMALEKERGVLYLGSSLGVDMLDAASGAWIGTAMDVARSAPGLQDAALISMAVDGEQNMYCYGESSGEGVGRLYRYSIQSGQREDEPYTLTVTAPYRDDYFINVITQFEQEHPGQRVQYDYAYNSRRDFLNYSDKDGYFERMNMRLLAGDVGDLVVFESASWDIYHTFQKDLFLDLGQHLEESPVYKELYRKVMQGLTVEGKLRGVPLSTDYCYMQVNESLCQELGIALDWSQASWSDVLQLEEQLRGTDVYLFSMVQDSQRAFFRLLISNMPDLIDLEKQKVDLQQDWFLQLIAKWEAASRGENFARFTQRAGLTEDALLSIDWRTSDMPNPEYAASQAQLFEEETGMRMGYAPLPRGEKGSHYTAYSTRIYAISAASEQKDMAWSLIETGLKAEMQMKNSLDCCPVNGKAQEKQKERQREDLVRSGQEDFSPRLEELLGELDGVYRRVDCLYDMHHLKEDLAYPLLDYFQGGSSLKEALDKAGRNLWIRINE